MRIPRSALAAAIVVLALTACTPEAVDTDDSPTTAESGSPTPTPVETSEAPVEPTGLSADDLDNLEAAVNTGNTAAIEGYLSNPNTFIIAASECCGPQTPIETIGGLDYLQSATGPWTRATDAQVASYLGGFYVDYFPDGAFVLRSSDSDPFVISFQITGTQVTGIFISAGESLLF